MQYQSKIGQDIPTGARMVATNWSTAGHLDGGGID